MAYGRFGALLAVACWLRAGEPPPQFTAEGVARGDSKAAMLVPDKNFSIYGRNLGPDCGTPVSGSQVLGTQVLINNQPAPLLYVSEHQINFVVPKDLAEQDAAELRVVCGGRSSEPVLMPAGFEKTTVQIEEAAYIDMPIWLRVSLPFEGEQVSWPSFFDPAGFGCYQVEARKDGILLPLLEGSRWLRGGNVFSGNVCGTSSPETNGRLPIHLLYRFSDPGTYEVRFSQWTGIDRFQKAGLPRFQSLWTPIEVLPARPGMRHEWLRSLAEHLPNDREALITETFPNLLGLPDEESLAILTKYLNHTDPSVRKYAGFGLYYFREQVLRAHGL